jgi:UDP-N-acetylglucosamine 1-carboxyvinyltransferase
MGAEIMINGKTAIVTGKKKLKSTDVYARDLRAGAALIIAGLAAEGTTQVHNIHFVERGYENIIQKLTALGANIRRVEEE